MKKLLALVLALVMSMSLVTISNAAYSDKADIDLKEAVDVLSAVGVFEGSDGKFDPKADLTREQAAKLVAYLQLGQKSADALVGGNKFTDVAANRWSAGYVDYCATTGVVAGVGNGQFNPTGSLTALQFGKMLLVCLGYDATTENLTGADWQINTSKLMASAKLLKGLDSVKANDVITREQAAQMMLNAIKAPTVEYDTKGSTITIGGTVIGIGGSKATYVTATVAEDKNAQNIGKTQLTNAGGYTVELGEKLFSTLKLGPATDAFERPASKWTIKSTEIGTYVNTPDLTYTEAVKLGTIYSDLALSDSIKKGAVEFVMDGAASEAGLAADGTTALSGLAITKGNSTKIGGNGVLVEVYYNDVANTAKVILVNTYAGEVTSVRAATASKDANVTVTPMNAARGGVYETEDFKVDDAVTYNYSNKAGDTGVKNVAKAEQVTGTLTGYSSSSVVVGGTTYKFNKAASISTATLAGAVDKDVTLTLDEYGFVLDVDAAATSTNYAVVLKYSDATTWDNAKAKLLFTDGTTKTVELNANTTKLGGGALTEGDVVSYTINNKGKYVLTVLNDAATQSSDATMVTKGNATMTAIDGIAAVNGKTIFLIATKNGSDVEYSSYTGIANVPTVTLDYTDTAIPVGVYAKNGTVATVVYINASMNNSSITGSSDNVVFVLGNSDGPSYDSVKGTYYTYDAIVNGEITTIDVAGTNQQTGFAMYNTITKDANGVATLSNTTGITGNGTTIAGTDREANGSITLYNRVLSYADDCEVFYIDTDKNISVSSIAGISKDATDKVWYKVVDNEVVAIVIYQVVSTARSIANPGSSHEVTVAGTGITGASVSYNGSIFTITVTGTPAAGDTVTLTPQVSAGAVVNSVTVAYNGSTWAPASASFTVTAESGDTTTVTKTISVS